MESFPTPDLMTAYPHHITFFGLPFLTKELQFSYDLQSRGAQETPW